MAQIVQKLVLSIMSLKRKKLACRPLKIANRRRLSPTVKRFKVGLMNTHVRGIKVGTSKAEDDWLNKLGVVKRQIVFRGFNNKIYVVDGVDPEKRIVYEFLGCSWHGHYTHLRLDNFNSMTKKTNRMMYLETRERFQYFHDLGWHVFFVWECEWRKGLVGRFYRGIGDSL